MAATSRYVRRRVLWPGEDDRNKIEFLAFLSSRHNLREWLLVPTDDCTVALVARHHELFASFYRLTVPPWQELQWTSDKRLLHQLVQRLGISEPWTACPLNREEFAEIDCPFPVILKPAVRMHVNSLAIPKAWPADDRAALLAHYAQASRLIGPGNLIVQEVVPGGGEAQFSYAALCKHGTSLARIVARRTRQFPRDFGQFSTFVESIEEPGVVEPAERLLSATKFTGLVEVEFKRDPRDGLFKVLDMNPRVWGWHTLARRAGLDFPYLLWRLMNGLEVPEFHGRAGERWMHLSADLRVALEDLLCGRLSLPAYLDSFRGSLESAIFSWDDPLPGLLDLPLFALTLVKRRIGG